MTKPAKSGVYRWRSSPKLQAELAAAAKTDRTSVDAILTRLVREWLAKRPRQLSEEEDAEEQCRLREQATKVVGTVSIGGLQLRTLRCVRSWVNTWNPNIRRVRGVPLGDLVDRVAQTIVRVLHEQD
jgi:hypothetical protein